MKVELHMIQNFAPSCLNRDDTNSPKDCEFGGFRRARISSQCIKRSIRTSPVFKELVPDNRGVRTKLLYAELKRRLEASQAAPEDVEKVVPAFIRHLCDMKGEKTNVLLYLGADEIDRMSSMLLGNWDDLVAAAPAQEKADAKGSKTTTDEEKAFARLLKPIASQCMTGPKAVDIALFGRMVAESPSYNIDAACQVAHAISTHRVSMEMDFYTAVDDLLPKEQTGAGMMGTVEFNSACFYRYALVDVDQLKDNLGGDEDLVLLAVKAFLEAAVAAVPAGKQTSMAAQNLPSFVMAVVRESGSPQSLANAFERPVVPTMGQHGGLVDQSIQRLDGLWGKLDRMYGTDGVKNVALCALDDLPLPNLKSRKVGSVREVIAAVRGALK